MGYYGLTADEHGFLVTDWADSLVRPFEEQGIEAKPSVDKLTVVVGQCDGVAFFVHEEHTGLWWSCYYDGAAGDMHWDKDTDPDEWLRDCQEFWWGESTGVPMCPCQQCEVDRDPRAWVDMLVGATDWENWEWRSYIRIPDVY